jgi:hypothetical protein
VTSSPSIPHRGSPVQQVLAHAHPAAGFPAGTVLLVAAALLAGVAAGLLLHLMPGARRGGRAGRRGGQADRDADGSGRQGREPAGPVTVSAGGLQAERDALVKACIRARDLAGSGVVRRVLGEALALAGVTEVDPTGQRFDPDMHCSVGVLHTPLPRLDATVASAERVGYDDHGRHLRPPEVIVFTSEPAP